jgi:hypothetical protein
MPTYCYRRQDTGEVVQAVMSVAEMERRQKRDGSIRLDDGAIAIRDLLAEHGGPKASPAAWPLHSEALAVHPTQIEEARAHSRSLGVPLEFDPIGCPIFVSRRHRRDYCRAIGVRDRDGGYGDP